MDEVKPEQTLEARSQEIRHQSDEERLGITLLSTAIIHNYTMKLETELIN